MIMHILHMLDDTFSFDAAQIQSKDILSILNDQDI